MQLALFEALLSRRLRGCWGDGGKSPEGPACTINLPDPARAIRDSHHNLEHFEQSLAPQCFPGRASLVLGGAQFGRGRECWEDLKKLLFIYVSQRAPAIALSRTVGSLFSVNRSALARPQNSVEQRGRRTAMGVFGKRAPSHLIPISPENVASKDWVVWKLARSLAHRQIGCG